MSPGFIVEVQARRFSHFPTFHVGNVLFHACTRHQTPKFFNQNWENWFTLAPVLSSFDWKIISENCFRYECCAFLFFFFYFCYDWISHSIFPIYARFFYTRAKYHGLTFTRFPNEFCERILMSEFKALRQVKNYHVFLNWRSFIYNSWIKNNNFWYTIYFLYICRYFELFLLVSDYTLPNGKHIKKNAIF